MLHVCACVLSVWRIRKNLHNITQTLVGTFLGISVGILSCFMEGMLLLPRAHIAEEHGPFDTSTGMADLLHNLQNWYQNSSGGPSVFLKLFIVCCAMFVVFLDKKRRRSSELKNI